jgi:NAD(P)-dependent dehydrogenase (short-subunit alcohol dehydrogenase family)
MPSRRTLLAGGAVAIAAAGGAAFVLRPRAPVQRPPGVPVGPFGASSTAEEVTAGLDLSGRRYLVTGASSGLGLESARVLALRGAEVIATGRSVDKVAEALRGLPGRFQPVALELTDFDAVRRCADEVAAALPRLDGLVCNAGIMELPQLEQVRGLEKQFVTNHLGHFLLVNRLLARVLAAPQGRVVVVSSNSWRRAPPAGIEFDNLSGERGYEPTAAYGQSKLANGLFVRELARRLAPTAATANVVRPGVVLTQLGRHQPLKEFSGRLLGWTFMKSIPAGAATQVYVATHPSLARVSGQFFADCNPELMTGPMADDALATRLWSVSTELTAPWLA